MTFPQHPTRPHSDPKPKLVSPSPSASAPASVAICHPQLRDLIVCPAERGVLWYVSDRSIVEQDILSDAPARQRTLALLSFTPVTISTLRLASSCPSGNDMILLAAGGQDAEIFLALYSYTPRRSRHPKATPAPRDLGSILDRDAADVAPAAVSPSDTGKEDIGQLSNAEEGNAAGFSTLSWQHTSKLVGSINNNVLLYMPPTPIDYGFSEARELTTMSPRLVVSNNDCTVKFFDVCLARRGLRRSSSHRPISHVTEPRHWRHDPGLHNACEGEGWGEKGQDRVVRYERVGCLRLPVPVNHTSISPDGSTVLSCGDTSTIYLYRILPVRNGSTIDFEPLATYTIPSPAPLPVLSPSSPPDSLGSSHGGVYAGYRPYPESGVYLPYAFVNGSWVLAGPNPYINNATGVEVPPACFTTAWSADGMRFAVASQEGAIRVWDIRSKEPLVSGSWQTGPRSSGESAEDGLVNMEAQRALFDSSGGAPAWGVRSLKFARNRSGRELLVFTEHVSRVHIIDADTFSTHDVLRVPHVQSSATGPPTRDDSHLPPFPTPWPVDVSSAPIPDVRRVSTGSYPPPWSSDFRNENVPRFMIDRSYDSGEETVAGTGSRQIAGASETEINADLETLLRRARADLRFETRSLGVPTPRRRRMALMPPEVRMSGAETGASAGRLLSQNIPLTHSPEPSAHFSLTEPPMANERQNRDAPVDREIPPSNESRRYTTQRVAAARRISEHIRARVRARRIRDMDEDQDELRRRNSVSILRDDAQMEEDIAYHDAMAAIRARERMMYGSHPVLARRARSSRESIEAEQREPLRNRVPHEMMLDDRDAYRERLPVPVHIDTLGMGNGVAETSSEPLVIPPLSSARSEEDVRNVLAVHGIPSIRSREGRDGVRNEQTLTHLDLPDIAPRRPSSSAASTSSSTAFSATTSTRAQAGSIIGEGTGVSRRGAESNSLLTPSIRNMRAARAALRAIDEYRMDIDDGGVDNGDDSDATELDCAEPTVMSERDRLSENSLAGPSSVGTESDSNASSSDSSPAVSPMTDVSIASMSLLSPSTSEPEPEPNAALVTEQNQNVPPMTSAEMRERGGASTTTTAHSLPPCRDLIESADRLDVAGVTFDPRGAYMYVATVDGITEWAVRGAEQRWWDAGGCI